ncbi:MAG: RING-HC finger protein [Candidatus Babeliales bacterium]|jgi:hypothetical protein
MKHALKKLITVFCLSISLSTTTPPQLAARTKDNIELVTALLRGYAAYSEYELRNDTSRSAHVKRVLIHAVRLINDVCACSAGIISLYDVIKIAKYVRISMSTIKQTDQKRAGTTNETTISNNERETLRRFALPAIEMLGALCRTNDIARHLPWRSGPCASLAVDMSRCVQIYFGAPENSAARKVVACLLALYIIRFVSTMGKLASIKLFPGDRCAICLESYDHPCVLGCGHFLCANCYGRLLGSHLVKRGFGNRPTCPNCRVGIDFATAV